MRTRHPVPSPYPLGPANRITCRWTGLRSLYSLLLVLLPFAAAGEATPEPAPPPSAPAHPPAPTPAPKPTSAPAPAPAPTPAPAPKPTPPPPLIPEDLPNGQSILHFYLFDDVTLTQLMLHNGRIYGRLKGAPVDYDFEDVTGFESNARAEVQMKSGQLPLTVRKSLLRQNLFYFLFDDESQMLSPAPKVAGLYPPDRFRLYPEVFHKFFAPWGTPYDQRPFYIQLDGGYVQIQNVVRTEFANGHLLTGSDIGLWRIRLEGYANYGRTEKITTTNNVSGEFKVDRYIDAWLYAYAKTGLFHDDVNFVHYRWTNGVGLGLGTFQQDNLLGKMINNNKIDLEAGLDRIEESNRDGTQIGWFARFALSDRLHLNDFIDFDNRVEYLPGLILKNRNDDGQYFIHYRSELRFRLWTLLHLRVAYNFDYNSRPPANTPPDTHQVSINLGFTYSH